MEGPQGRSIGSEAATACRRPMSRPSGTRHPNGMARARGRRSAEAGAAFLKKFLCIFWETNSEKFVCRISVSPRGPPKIGAHPPPPLRGPLPASRPPPPLRCPLPDFAASAVRGAEPGGPRAGRGACGAACGARRTQPLPRYAAPSRILRRAASAARAANGRVRRGACGARRTQAHPRYAAPSPDFAASAARGAEPGECAGRRVVRGPCASPPPLRCPLPADFAARSAGGGRTRVARCRTARARCAVRGRERRARNPSPVPPPRFRG
jgi:hypothetical protein